VVTSGCPSPTLGVPIAMAYLRKDHASPGTPVEVDTGKGERLTGKVSPLPFYKVRK
jgi:aminomethyltransferase